MKHLLSWVTYMCFIIVLSFQIYLLFLFIILLVLLFAFLYVVVIEFWSGLSYLCLFSVSGFACKHHAFIWCFYSFNVLLKSFLKLISNFLKFNLFYKFNEIVPKSQYFSTFLGQIPVFKPFVSVYSLLQLLFHLDCWYVTINLQLS